MDAYTYMSMPFKYFIQNLFISYLILENNLCDLYLLSIEGNVVVLFLQAKLQLAYSYARAFNYCFST